MKKLSTQIIYLILLCAGFALLIIELYPKTYMVDITPVYLPLMNDLIFSIGASLLLVSTYIYNLIYSKYFNKVIVVLNYIVYGIGLALLLFEGILLHYVKVYNIAIYVSFTFLLVLLIVQIILLKKKSGESYLEKE